MKRLMIGAATAIALLAGPVLASDSNSGVADSPAARSAGVTHNQKNPPCVPGRNDVACGSSVIGKSGKSGASGSSTMGSGSSYNRPSTTRSQRAPDTTVVPRSSGSGGSDWSSPQ